MTDYENFRIQAHHLDFMKYMWRKKGDPLKVGLHTKAICDRIDEAINDFDEGISTYLIITVPFRHGKSDIISRYEPAHFIGNHKDCDVMIVTYASSLAIGFSRFARNLVNTEEYEMVFHKKIDPKKGASDEWGVDGGQGTVTASGLTSGITGKGYHLGILDDYCANREEAESVSQREKAWQSFTNDFFTRQAPVSITIILATPWHVDDIIGRIKALNDEKGDSYDPEFEKFEVISFPAMNGEVQVLNENNEIETVKYDYLFTEKTLSTGEKFDGRFSPRWYERQKASLGTYGTASLLQCNPQTRGGNFFKVSKIKWHDSEEDFPKTQYKRVWDYAHTEKQINKNDPDWTSGTLLTYTKIDGEWHCWVKHVARMKGKATERDNYVRSVTDKDGANVPVYVENSLDSKDAVSTMQDALVGKRVVNGINIKMDKIARAGYLEPIFEAGHVHVLRGDWNFEWLSEIKDFPSGKHDDQVDNLTAGYQVCCKENPRISVGHVSGW